MNSIINRSLLKLVGILIILIPNNKFKYNLRQRLLYFNGTNNHDVHNNNPDYWDILLQPLRDHPERYRDSLALDFGCGRGRNIFNLISFGLFERVDGVDISHSNIDYLRRNYSYLNSNFYKNNGLDLNFIESNQYEFIMSTIVLQHIPVFEIRDSILRELLES